MARRGYGSGSGYRDPAQEPEEEVHVTEGEVTETEVAPPLTEKQIKMNELDAYYGKVVGDLERSHGEAVAAQSAAEARIADLDAQKTQVDAEYAERKAAIEAEPDAKAPAPPTRWGTSPAPKAEPALTS